MWQYSVQVGGITEFRTSRRRKAFRWTLVAAVGAETSKAKKDLCSVLYVFGISLRTPGMALTNYEKRFGARSLLRKALNR